MDIVDKAQESIDREYELLSDHWANNQRASDDDGPDRCLDCDEIIPFERKKLGFCLRCVDCQTAFEKALARRKYR
ncbi:MAG: TraR/DksA family transcriptional regulator [Gammaproteobacteria bacterium]|nr:TraR/DksA family transcriptional regulator [Gammaproteobacteria bacterium]